MRQSSIVNRRGFLVSGATVAAATVYARSAEGGELSAEEKVNVQVVNDFCAAWSARDLPKIVSYFAETVSYRMTETAEPLKGRDAVAGRLKTLIANVAGFDVLDTFARGPMVVNERIDRFSGGPIKAWRGVGVFFLKDRKIVEWNDYTISLERG